MKQFQKEWSGETWILTNCGFIAVWNNLKNYSGKLSRTMRRMKQFDWFFVVQQISCVNQRNQHNDSKW